MNNQMREEFEAWVIITANQREYLYPDSLLSRSASGDYHTTWVDSAWLGWQASRAALVVELPPAPDPRTGGGDYYFGMTHGINGCKAAITKTGVRVK